MTDLSVSQPAVVYALAPVHSSVFELVKEPRDDVFHG